MRVAHVSNGEFYAGAERVQDILAIELSRLGCEITFVLLKPNQFDRVRRSRAVPVVRASDGGSRRPACRVEARVSPETGRFSFDARPRASESPRGGDGGATLWCAVPLSRSQPCGG